jgi:hypothetical protein
MQKTQVRFSSIKGRISKTGQARRRGTGILTASKPAWGRRFAPFTGWKPVLRKPTGKMPVLRQSGGFAVHGQDARATRNWWLGPSSF